jgi:sugar fermentation stimulation protein A
MIAQGDRAVVLFTVQRQDCDAFSACRDIDPKFAQALEEAAEAGVEVLVYECEMSRDAIEVGRKLEWLRAS